MSKAIHHCVFGAGLIGCYLAGVIKNKGLRCSVVLRDSMFDKLERGLLLTDYQGHQARVDAPARVATQDSTVEPVSVLWLTVKCTGVKAALAEMKPLITSDTLIVCCQNGLGSASWVQRAFPDNTVVRAMVPFNVVETDQSGQFHRGSEGTMAVEVSPGKEQWIRDCVMPVAQDLLPLKLESHMDELLWAKLQLNLGNSINAIADIPVKAMLSQRGYRRIIAALMEELLRVTDSKGIQLPKVTSVPAQWVPKVLRLPNWLFTRVANKMIAIDPKVKTSMWWDLHKGRRTEIDFLNGAIVEHGEQLGVPTPTNAAVQGLIREMEQGRVKQGMSAEALTHQLGLS